MRQGIAKLSFLPAVFRLGNALGVRAKTQAAQGHRPGAHAPKAQPNSSPGQRPGNSGNFLERHGVLFDERYMWD
jgi:hypothetical protein